MDIVLSGMRPTGRLHLGNYVGALRTWIELQEKARCLYMVADWHALTSEYDNTRELEGNVWEMVLDWLAAGLDPERATLFRQSWARGHAELYLLLAMITPLPWLERNPTYKEQLQEVQNRDLSTYGFLGYPVLQAADILIYRATQVPVGEDQLPHLELTREIARRFNHLYGPVFPEPQAYLSRAPKLPGIDARKMSKSYGNVVLLSEPKETLKTKVKQMFTDPKKIHATDKGNPYGCVVFAHHQLYTAESAEIEERCQAGTIGCVACKERLMVTLEAGLAPFREKRQAMVKKKDAVRSMLVEGTRKADVLAESTLDVVRQAMGFASSGSRRGAG